MAARPAPVGRGAHEEPRPVSLAIRAYLAQHQRIAVENTGEPPSVYAATPTAAPKTDKSPTRGHLVSLLVPSALS